MSEPLTFDDMFAEPPLRVPSKTFTTNKPARVQDEPIEVPEFVIPAVPSYGDLKKSLEGMSLPVGPDEQEAIRKHKRDRRQSERKAREAAVAAAKREEALRNLPAHYHFSEIVRAITAWESADENKRDALLKSMSEHVSFVQRQRRDEAFSAMVEAKKAEITQEG